MFWGHLSEMLLYRASEATTFVNTCRLPGTDPHDAHLQLKRIQLLGYGSAWGACTPAPLPASRRSTHFKPLGILKSPHATTACGAPSRSSDPKPLVSGVTENGSGSKGLNVV